MNRRYLYQLSTLLIAFISFSGCSTRFEEGNGYDDPFIWGGSSGSYIDYSSQLKRKFPDVYPRKVLRKNDMELVEVFYDEVKGWKDDDKRGSLEAYVRGCARKSKLNLEHICREAESVLNSRPEKHEVTSFFEQFFTPYIIYDRKKEADNGLVTGYYVPMLKGSRTKTSRYKYPIYGKPRDFKLPYYTHREIDRRKLNAPVICWVDDRVDRFFLHIQGSGTVKLRDGTVIGIGYTAQNGYKYTSIGSYMVRNFGLDKNRLSAQYIKEWLRKNPRKADEVLHSNKSFVFFIEQGKDRAIGAMNTNLVAESTIAVDTNHIPLGSPIFIRTTHPRDGKELNHLFMAQDKGGAIKGIIRADLFFGFGDGAGKKAGNMKNRGEFYILLPHDQNI